MHPRPPTARADRTDPRTPLVAHAEARTDAEVFGVIAFELRTDDTKRCENEAHGQPCVKGASWLGTLDACPHTSAVCTEHKLSADAWLARDRDHYLECLGCGAEASSITWRPL